MNWASYRFGKSCLSSQH